jgi:hypothetical protein
MREPSADTPLHRAGSSNDVDVLDALLDRGRISRRQARCSRVARRCQTPWCSLSGAPRGGCSNVAHESGASELVQWLLANGAKRAGQPG